MAAEFIFSVITTLSGLLTSLRSSKLTCSNRDGDDGIERDLDRLERLLQRIQVTLQDAGEKEIREASIKHWLKEIKTVAFEAEDILDELKYELLHRQIEKSGEEKATSSTGYGTSRKRLAGAIPDGMADSIKRVIGRFEEISRDREALFLREDDGKRRGFAVTDLLPTGHMVNESAIFGRDGDKKRILDFVLFGNKGATNNHISVISIVGMGGVGKTTLAQLVYNDPLVRCYFDMTAWAYVSPQFDVARISKEVLQCIFKKVDSGLTGLSAVQQAIGMETKGKKIFIVLDDVWNELFSKWEQFLEPLRGAESVRILVTTRNKTVAEIAQTGCTYNLSCLPQDQSSLLFEHYAFGGEVIHGSSKFRDIGAQIVKRCAGLPLAIKAIGRALSCNFHEDWWRDISESELWESGSKDEIFPALKVSYYTLPPELKPCLLFCSLFPKGYQFHRDEIIYMWIAHGYVQSRGRKSEEDVGDEFMLQLDRRSFITLDKRKWEVTFTLHDLIHDLARSISVGEFFTSTRESTDDVISSEVHHVYTENYNMMNGSNDSCLLIRTLVNNAGIRVTDIDYNLHMDRIRDYNLTLCTNKNLRVLKCEGAHGHDLEHMANLKHLRYLELRHSTLKRLPESIIVLFNLVSLRISFLKHLEELPVQIGKLINLRFLSISNVDIRELPESLGQLSNLQMLYLCSCHRILKLPNCIGSLINLRELHIDDSYITELPKSICMLNKLQTLVLNGCCYIMLLPDGIGNLVNLRCMYVLGGSFRKLPKSINHLCNLEVLELETYAPLIGLLSKLKGLLNKISLKILIAKIPEHELYDWASNIDQVFEGTKWQYWGPIHMNLPEYPDMCSKYTKSTSLLECLQPINDLIELRLNGYEGLGYPRWFSSDSSNRAAIFLQCYLNNRNLFAEFEETPSLKSLYMIGGNLGENFFQTMATRDFKVIFPSLEEIEFTDMLEWNIPAGEQDGDLPVLRSLKINNCPSLCSVPKFACLRRLDIIKCSFPRLEFDMLHWDLLESLHIEECIQLTSLMGLQNLNSLRTLYVVRCPRLEEFSYPVTHTLPFFIEIVECPSLKSWCQSQQFTYIKDFSCKMLATSGIRNIMKKGDHDFLLEHLLIRNSIEKSLGFHEGLRNLVKLEIKSCWRLETLKGLSELQSLKSLVLWDCPLLQLDNGDSGSDTCLPPFLVSLVVHGCHCMLSLDVLLLNPSFLTELEVTNCRNLMLIKGLQILTKLETLAIIRCPKLILELLHTVPDCVVISGCPRLKAWCGMHSIDPLDDETDFMLGASE